MLLVAAAVSFRIIKAPYPHSIALAEFSDMIIRSDPTTPSMPSSSVHVEFQSIRSSCLETRRRLTTAPLLLVALQCNPAARQGLR
jgi:hypothetical protein